MKDQQMRQAISEYLLTADTSFALMLSGKWGCGKTFYWKKVISKEIIEKTKSVYDSEGKLMYKPLYISLYGIENTDEISKRIFLELIPKTSKSKVSGIITTIGTKLVSAATSFFNLGDLSLDIEEIKSLYNLKNCVITFDDLERIAGDDDLLNKVLGFINYLSEHENIKVILLTNEDELNNKFEAKWSKTKEKIVNQTVPFTADYDNIIIEMINSFSRFTAYHNFLVHNKSLIIKAFNLSSTNNLRTLRFSIEQFLKLYNLFEKNSELDFFKHYGGNLLYYTLVVSFEHKKGFINKEDSYGVTKLTNESIVARRMLDRMYHNSSPSQNGPAKEKSAEQKYCDEFIDKYFKDGEQLINVKLFFDFIITGLYDDNLIKTLKNSYLPKDNSDSPQISCLNILINCAMNGISQKDIVKNINQVISYANKGEYHIMYYSIIFDLFYNLNKQKIYQGIKLPYLKKILLKAIVKANQFEYNRTIIPQVEQHWGASSSNYLELRKKYYELIDINYTNQYKRDAVHFLKLLTDQPNEALDFIFKPNSNNEINILFKFCSIKKIYECILSFDNQQLIEFYYRINYRFNKVSIDMINSEKDSLDKLKNYLGKYISKRKTYDIRVYHIETLIRIITKIVEKKIN